MWNVLGYCKDFINDKVDFEEFKRIYKDQRPLKSFINDLYKEILNSKFKDEFLEKFKIKFPFENFKNLDEFILNNSSFEDVKSKIKLIIEYFLKLNS